MASKSPRHRPFSALRALRDATGRRPERPVSFEEVMKRTGTAPLARSAGRVRRTAPAPMLPPALVGPVFETTEREGFLEGRRVELPLRVLRTLSGTPNATLDLHGFDAKSARRELRRFVAGARARGHVLVLVIVGKGRHSPGGLPVLRNEIGDWLMSAPLGEDVLAFRSAPAELGGSGSLLVLISRGSAGGRVRAK